MSTEERQRSTSNGYSQTESVPKENGKHDAKDNRQAEHQTPPRSSSQHPRHVKLLKSILKDTRVWGPLALHICAHKFAAHVVNTTLPASTLRTLSPSDRLYLAEKLPSTLNALIVSLPSLHLLLRQQPYKHDLFKPYPELLDRVFAAHLGFTIYDMWVMAVQGREHFSVWVHHVLGVLGTGLMRYFKVASLAPAAFCPSEATVVVSNAIWIMQKLKLDGSGARGGGRGVEGRSTQGFERIYGALLVVRAIMFVIFRASAGPLLFWYVFSRPQLERSANKLNGNGDPKSKHPTITNSDEPLLAPNADSKARLTPPHKPTSLYSRLCSFWSIYKRLPIVVSVLTAINVLTFTGLNFWWTWLTTKAVSRWRKERVLSRVSRGIGDVGMHHI
ncbi:hypothetical protein HK102_003120 [Quaeritorhiza haematococci]|nr:hypothetical protein HK102_003120 [Quaeritorhiza haematococci]